MQTQTQVAGEARAIAVGTGARGSTILAHSRIVTRVVGLCSGLGRLPVLALLTLGLGLHRGHLKKQSRCAVCHETRDAMSIRRIRRHVRAARSFSREGVDKASGAGLTGCRVRAFSAARCGPARGRPRREDGRRESYRLTSTRRPTAPGIFTRLTLGNTTTVNERLAAVEFRFFFLLI